MITYWLTGENKPPPDTLPEDYDDKAEEKEEEDDEIGAPGSENNNGVSTPLLVDHVGANYERGHTSEEKLDIPNSIVVDPSSSHRLLHQDTNLSNNVSNSRHSTKLSFLQPESIA
jgi:hypothetical protein